MGEIFMLGRRLNSLEDVTSETIRPVEVYLLSNRRLKTNEIAPRFGLSNTTSEDHKRTFAYERSE